QHNTGENITGTKFHIKSITYAELGNHKYKIDFLTDDANRPDKIINARLGFIQLTPHLLNRIEVKMKENTSSELIRAYEFSYFESSFGKKLLSSIVEMDNNEEIFYSNSIDYYDETGGSNLVLPNPDSTWEGNEDYFSSINSQGSLLGTSISDGFSGGGRFGVGIGFDNVSVSTTVGGSINFGKNTQDGVIRFLDINGDGLPDKIISNNNSVQYRPNTGKGVGKLITLSRIDRLEKTKSNTNGYGFDLNVGMGPVGFGVGTSTDKTKTETDSYFIDYNGDGLPDMITGNKIKFNTSNTTDDPS